MSKSEIVDIEVTLLHETDLAYLVDVGRGGVWVPKFIAEYNSRDKILTLPRSWAESKELV